ncbi:MAG: hypothetical protein KDC87_10075, partial [Planctomycetes bacterium]|nr:hypothetical protein [Planctomycetota bacterium]
LHDLLTRDLTAPASGKRSPSHLHPRFIEDFAATGHEGVAKLLQRIIQRPEVEPFTVQTCVVLLGKMKCVDAARRIQELYRENKSGAFGRVPNPGFRRRVVDAVVEILGPGSAEFLREVDRTESDVGLRKRLDDLRKEIRF